MNHEKSKTEQLIELEQHFGANNYKPLDVILNKGEGVWVWDVEGKKYMDCLSAYSAVNQGHCHPRILETMIEQVKRLTITSRAFRNDQLGLFYKEICELTNFQTALPMNSGAEAVETVIKAVRKWGYTKKGVKDGQAEIIVADGNFHGRTIAIVGFSSERSYREGFGPFAPGFKNIPYGDINAFEKAITPNTIGFLVEPIQGEAGVVVPPVGYLKEVRKICNDKNIALILDEIQTGLGRTGKMLAAEHEGIKADATLIGKALSGGFYPVSAVVSNNEILGVFNPGEHGSTFGGNPVACAVAREALRVLVEENMVENSAKLGDYFMAELMKIDSPYIQQIRGKGLFIGVVLKDSAGGARRFCESLQTKGILCKETHENVVRFAPPLVITKEEIDWAMGPITDVFCQ